MKFNVMKILGFFSQFVFFVIQCFVLRDINLYIILDELNDRDLEFFKCEIFKIYGDSIWDYIYIILDVFIFILNIWF